MASVYPLSLSASSAALLLALGVPTILLPSWQCKEHKHGGEGQNLGPVISGVGFRFRSYRCN